MSILGNVVGLPAPQPDWTQTDPAQADYIKNKPSLADPAQMSQALALAQGALPKSGGTMTGPIAMDGRKITGLGAAEQDGDAVSLGVLTAFYGAKVVPVTASLGADSWNGNSQTVNVAGITGSSTVIVTPAPASWLAYGEAGVRCTAQGAGNLTFRCEEAPAAAMAVNILILN